MLPLSRNLTIFTICTAGSGHKVIALIFHQSVTKCQSADNCFIDLR